MFLYSYSIFKASLFLFLFLVSFEGSQKTKGDEENWDTMVDEPPFQFKRVNQRKETLCPFCTNYKTFSKVSDFLQHTNDVHGTWSPSDHQRVIFFRKREGLLL